MAKCKDCGKAMNAAEDYASKWGVCGACTRKAHAKAVSRTSSKKRK
jgi:DNA-directed RNA polymerase subunit M/transcription elongation factor TFIIS